MENKLCSIINPLVVTADTIDNQITIIIILCQSRDATIEGSIQFRSEISLIIQKLTVATFEFNLEYRERKPTHYSFLNSCEILW